MMQAVGLDHLVVAAADLQQGVRFVRDKLGVEIPFGGAHASMGTHNHLMRLADTIFLEVIAVNPGGVEPTQPRWYGLDDPYVRAAIDSEPALVGWVVNTKAIDEMLGGAMMQGHDFGKSVAVSRGDLHWKFGLPEDGRLLAAGMLPYVIEWGADSHPAAEMADTGCRLESLMLEHPHTDWIRNALSCIGAADLVSLTSAPVPRLHATIDTPNGQVILSGPQPK